MGKIKSIIQLLRIRQYYKNIILFIGVIFSGNIFNFDLYPQIILGFLLVCIASSFTYIINDIHDRDVDKIHPEKIKKRPLANGSISISFAIVLLILIGSIEIFFIVYYHNLFSLMLVLIIGNGLVYNFIFKDIAFADIIALSTIYIWRALAGCAIISVRISPWLTIIIFLFALFLATGKRIADLALLGDKNARIHKKIYDEYSQALLNKILNLTATSLFMTYVLYCVLGPLENDSLVPKNNQGLLVFTVPIALFLIIRFMYIIRLKPSVARSAEKLIFDKSMVIGSILLMLTVFITLYLELNFLFFENIITHLNF